ncbi:TetR/AcrR family transcriptional regulator [Rhodococcus hoagii]|nr:TetR/AcrR family transcriptional regulator [Prescottella equi]
MYRYVASRDELLTLLVIDGYNELGAEVDAAVDALPAGDHRGRLHALARAVRTWALREPARYALLFGSPVPGYHAPAERTTGTGYAGDRRAGGAHRGRAAVGGADGGGRAGRPGAVRRPRPDPRGDGIDGVRALLARGVLVWAALFGACEIRGVRTVRRRHVQDPAALFEHHLAVLDQILGLG